MQPKPGHIATPCTGHCLINPENGYCEGCWRTMREIANWTSFSPEKRDAVMHELGLREKGLIGPADDD